MFAKVFFTTKTNVILNSRKLLIVRVLLFPIHFLWFFYRSWIAKRS